MAKRGRPKKSGKREPNGRIARTAVDHGTPEVQARRAWMAQGGDVTKTSYPLGVMLANGAITEDQHRAGCRYAWLYSLIAGRTSITAQAYDEVKHSPREHDPEWLAAREVEFKEACADLLALGRRAKDLIDNAAVYGRYPRWMTPAMPRVSDVREAGLTSEALDMLAVSFGYARKKVA